ncbi:hypothetical protein N9K34_04220 [Candidatus Pelagibacter bacterium]|nr:hypothetical protein [Candidatus Pelagibacter bacterium]
MTKKLTFKIKAKPNENHAVGQSVYVRYYNDNFKANFEKKKDKINEDFDFDTFLTNHEKKCIWVGRGLTIDEEPSIQVLEDDKPVKLSSDKSFHPVNHIEEENDDCTKLDRNFVIDLICAIDERDKKNNI